jgi:hypothetical protein
MRYREPYATAGLNAKLAVNTPRGTYRGFRLSTHASNNTITVVADAAISDHVLVYETLGGYSMTVRRVGGDFSVDLSGLVDVSEKTWVVCVYGTYDVGVTTAAEIRAYELSPTDEFTPAPENGELVVLGTVVVPAGGGSVTPSPDRRTFSWASRTNEAVSWSALLRNGGFDFSYDALGSDWEEASAFWWRETTVADAYWETEISDVHSGSRALNWLHQGTASSGSCSQDVNISVEEGRLLRYRFYKKALQVSTGGDATFNFNWLDSTGAATTPTEVDIDLTGVDADYVEVEGVAVVPTGSAFLGSVSFTNTLLDFGASSVGYRVDDVQVWLEAADQSRDQSEATIGNVRATAVVLHDRSEAGALSSAPNLAGLLFDGDLGQEHSGSPLGGVRFHRPGKPSTYQGPSLIVPVNTSYTWTLIHESAPAGEKTSRVYVSSTGGYCRTLNAKYDNGTAVWTKDVGGQAAFRFKISAVAGESF